MNNINPIAKMLNGKLVEYDFCSPIPVGAEVQKSYSKFCKPIGMGYIYSTEGMKQVYRGTPARYAFYKSKPPLPTQYDMLDCREYLG